MRRGVTLLELAVTMVVFGLVMALVARTAVFHERLQRRERALADGARAARQAVAIVVQAVEGASPGDLIAAASADSALEIMAPMGAGIGCLAGGAVVVAAAAVDGPGAIWWNSDAKPGDRALLFDGDAGLAGWQVRTITGVGPGVGGCAILGEPPAGATTLYLDAPVGDAPFVGVRIARRTRFTLYRSGDGAWYLGLREWNPDAGGFNGVQPVAGPLHARSVLADRTGLLFAYLDSTGRTLPLPLDSAARPAAIEVTARSADASATVLHRVVALRHAP